MQVRPLGQEDPLEEGMATRSSVLALESPQGRVAELDTNEATWHKIDIEWENFLTVEVSVTQRFLSLSFQGVSWNEWI